MKLRIVTAGVGIQWESALVQACQDGAVRAVVVQRCHDAGDLLAVAASGKAEVALVASGMRWLDRDTVVRLGSAGLAIVGVVPAGDEHAERRLRQLGIDHVAQGKARPVTLIEHARAAIAGRMDGHGGPGDDRSGQARHLPAPRVEPTDADASGSAGGPDGADGRNALVVVWGPKGAPGRTTVAVNLAFEARPLAGEVLLVDADTYGGSISQTLGFLEEHPGLAWAARSSSRGELDAPKLWHATHRAGPGGPRVLSGLPRADLWTEIRPGTWQSLLELFRLSFRITVVDVGFCLEEEEELLYDHVRFRRNAVTRLALQQADLVIAVARADPVGLHDFIRSYQQLRDIGVDPRHVRVVVNQLRGGLYGGDAAPQIRTALNRYLGVEPSVFVPYDRGAMDNALMMGKALREVRRGSGPQQAMEALAAVVVGAPAAAPQRRRLRRRVARRRTVLWNGRPSGPTMTSRNLGW
ncbi:MAG TPA: chromosome partitioning protein [Actinomycetes bacterium]